MKLYEVEGSGLRAICISDFESQAQFAAAEVAGVLREADGIEMDEDPEVGVPVPTGPVTDWTKDAYKTRIEAFYNLYNPAKVKDVPKLIEKYEGKLEKLWQALHTKYLAKDSMAETIESVTKEYPNLTVPVPEDEIPTPTNEQLEDPTEERWEVLREVHRRSAAGGYLEGEARQHVRQGHSAEQW